MPLTCGADVDRDAGDRRASRRSPASSPRTRSSPSAFGRGATAAGLLPLLGARASLAALLTAFYMARLMAMTFFGAEPHRRRGAGAPARGAVDHDRRRWSCSGVLSVGGRRCSTCRTSPAATPWLEHWLEPVLAPSHGLVPLVMPEGATETALIGLRGAAWHRGPGGGVKGVLRARRWRRRRRRCPRPDSAGC